MNSYIKKIQTKNEKSYIDVLSFRFENNVGIKGVAKSRSEWSGYTIIDYSTAEPDAIFYYISKKYLCIHYSKNIDL